MGVRPAESIDGLVRVADHKQAFSVSVPRLHQPELQGVDVLKLVHEKIVEPFGPFGVFFRLRFCHRNGL